MIVACVVLACHFSPGSFWPIEYWLEAGLYSVLSANM